MWYADDSRYRKQTTGTPIKGKWEEMVKHQPKEDAIYITVSKRISSR